MTDGLAFFEERRESIPGGSHENVLVFERPRRRPTHPSPFGVGGATKVMFAMNRKHQFVY